MSKKKEPKVVEMPNPRNISVEAEAVVFQEALAYANMMLAERPNLASADLRLIAESYYVGLASGLGSKEQDYQAVFDANRELLEPTLRKCKANKNTAISNANVQ